MGAAGAGVARVCVGAEGREFRGYKGCRLRASPLGLYKGRLVQDIVCFVAAQSARESTEWYVPCVQPTQKCAEGHGVQHTGCAAAQLYPKNCSAPAKSGSSVQGWAPTREADVWFHII